jgi:circadian clock protein KaiA
LHPQLSICTFVLSSSLAQSLRQFLSSDRYNLTQLTTQSEFFDFIEEHKQQIDCLILQSHRSLLPLVNRLYEQGTLLPVAIIFPQAETADEQTAVSHLAEIGAISVDELQPIHLPISEQSGGDRPLPLATILYHTAEVHLSLSQLDQIASFIERAIAQFINLAPTYPLQSQSTTLDLTTELTAQNFLMLQQRRLAEKLKERLGYLGVYYKRNPHYFLRNLSATDKQELLINLRSDYRQIILHYFSNDTGLNQKIDNFVNTVFFADMSVSQIVEIHMELMDKFAKQLKLEGRNEEVLLDYRLTLIDIIAHLCEMYRRSIPREV